MLVQVSGTGREFPLLTMSPGQVQGTVVTDLMIQAISNHINLALGDRDFDAVRAHRTALGGILALAPPVETFNETSQRIIVWTDVRAAATLLEKPQIPSCSPRIPVKQGSEVGRRCHKRALRTLSYLPPPEVESINPLYQVFRELHLAAYGGLAHYVLARTLAIMTADALAPDVSFTPCEAVILSASITSWSFSHFGELPSDANLDILEALFSRLSKVGDLMSFWKNNNTSPESLLWVLFTANASILAMEEWGILSKHEENIKDWLPASRTWFQYQLQQTLAESGITEYSALKEVLSLFPYMAIFHAYFGSTIATQCALTATPEEINEDLEHEENATTSKDSGPGSPGSDCDDNVQRKGIAAELGPE